MGQTFIGLSQASALESTVLNFETPAQLHSPKFSERGAQWISGRVIDFWPSGCWLEPRQHPYIWVWIGYNEKILQEQDAFILA